MTETRKIPRRAKGHRPGYTRERIIKRCIALFNRDGLRNVSIIRIAKDLGISTGNLTYHFPRKQELIVATLRVMKERLRASLESQNEVESAKDSAIYLVNLYRTLWDFRFFFNALTFVLSDAQLHREYTEFREWAMKQIESNLVGLVEMGYFVQPREPNSLSLLTENMWSLWLNWLRAQQVSTPLAGNPDNEALYSCALHDWAICEPHMRPEFARLLLKHFQRLLL